eukprot:5003731-Pyramimonas_sp.AAC.1
MSALTQRCDRCETTPDSGDARGSDEQRRARPCVAISCARMLHAVDATARRPLQTSVTRQAQECLRRGHRCR